MVAHRRVIRQMKNIYTIVAEIGQDVKTEKIKASCLAHAKMIFWDNYLNDSERNNCQNIEVVSINYEYDL